MAAQRTFLRSQGWVQCDSVLVVEIAFNGMTINAGKFVDLAGVNEFIDVRPNDESGWLSYRVRTDNPDGDIIRSGYLPQWRVVEVIATT